MRCRETIKRNGYYTGRRCTREATVLVVFNEGTDNEDARACCAQHANGLVKDREHWTPPPVKRPLVEPGGGA